jgi:hypothetical protein
LYESLLSGQLKLHSFTPVSMVVQGLLYEKVINFTPDKMGEAVATGFGGCWYFVLSTIVNYREDQELKTKLDKLNYKDPSLTAVQRNDIARNHFGAAHIVECTDKVKEANNRGLCVDIKVLYQMLQKHGPFYLGSQMCWDYQSEGEGKMEDLPAHMLQSNDPVLTKVHTLAGEYSESKDRTFKGGAHAVVLIGVDPNPSEQFNLYFIDPKAPYVVHRCRHTELFTAKFDRMFTIL